MKCKAKEEATETERKALTKREATREKTRLKAKKKNRKEDEKNPLSGRSSFNLLMTSKVERAKSVVPIIPLDPARHGKATLEFMKVSTLCTSLNGQI